MKLLLDQLIADLPPHSHAVAALFYLGGCALAFAAAWLIQGQRYAARLDRMRQRITTECERVRLATIARCAADYAARYPLCASVDAASGAQTPSK